ncbi:hypothetical protein Zmor_013375 [Zophobas morio]|uniref:Exonuclease domain-containing protein n=1 Tax=Zophobas morio TaxID=2755281 RepID=A0AA38IDE5_9CUCU|nr:hypothetical protein Zmor_013375 [Zophobas morio]
MTTRELARKIGALEVIRVSKTNSSKQPFDFLFVIDFEATCWESADRKTKCPEIIEFPAVLYDVKNGEIVDEFQEYVMPTENPKLSDFCTQLTGIQQNQVDTGVPLSTCLFLFMKWVNEKKKLYGMEFPNSDDKAEKTCAFATWSDWDLGICFKNECNRKRLTYAKIFRKWIDIRHLYKFYFKKPFNGLSGALSELGLTFEGKEHCGLHDARNTAKLVGRMIDNGAILQLTRC